MSNDRDGKEDEDANNNEDDTDCEKSRQHGWARVLIGPPLAKPCLGFTSTW